MLDGETLYIRLDVVQAYKSMYLFLSDIYERTPSDEIGALLSGLSLLDDGLPADEAYWLEWTAAVKRALSSDDIDYGLGLKGSK